MAISKGDQVSWNTSQGQTHGTAIEKRVKEFTFADQKFKASADEPGLHIWWLGQSGFLVSVEGETILFDPYLSDWLTENAP